MKTLREFVEEAKAATQVEEEKEAGTVYGTISDHTRPKEKHPTSGRSYAHEIEHDGCSIKQALSGTKHLVGKQGGKEWSFGDVGMEDGNLHVTHKGKSYTFHGKTAIDKFHKKFGSLAEGVESMNEAHDIELKPHENGTHYIVHKIHPKSGIESDQLKVGEKLHDSEVDDLKDMYKVKIHSK